MNLRLLVFQQYLFVLIQKTCEQNPLPQLFFLDGYMGIPNATFCAGRELIFVCSLISPNDNVIITKGSSSTDLLRYDGMIRTGGDWSGRAIPGTREVGGIRVAVSAAVLNFTKNDVDLYTCNLQLGNTPSMRIVSTIDITTDIFFAGNMALSLKVGSENLTHGDSTKRSSDVNCTFEVSTGTDAVPAIDNVTLGGSSLNCTEIPSDTNANGSVMCEATIPVSSYLSAPADFQANVSCTNSQSLTVTFKYCDISRCLLLFIVASIFCVLMILLGPAVVLVQRKKEKNEYLIVFIIFITCGILSILISIPVTTECIDCADHKILAIAAIGWPIVFAVVYMVAWTIVIFLFTKKKQREPRIKRRHPISLTNPINWIFDEKV